MSSMNDVRKTVNQGLDDPELVADEIRVRLNLAGMDAKDAWRKLEPRLDETESLSLKPGWLTIVRATEGSREADVRCPYRGMIRVSDCFSCKDYASLAIDPAGHSSFIVCTRAEGDGVATTADAVVPGVPDEIEP